eukprot:7383078-Prymnesium_polylepis.1
MDTLPHLSKPSLRASHVPFFFALMAGAGRRARAAQRDGAGGTGACRCQVGGPRGGARAPRFLPAARRWRR